LVIGVRGSTWSSVLNVGAGGPGGRDDPVDGEIALGGGRRSQQHRLVGEEHVERLPVGLGEDGDAGDAHLAAGPDDPDGDLAAIGDEDLRERRAHDAPDHSRSGA